MKSAFISRAVTPQQQQAAADFVRQLPGLRLPKLGGDHSLGDYLTETPRVAIPSSWEPHRRT